MIETDIFLFNFKGIFLMADPYEVNVVKNWHDLDELNNKYVKDEKYSFRGQSNAGWPLRTSLERVADLFSIKSIEIPKIEEGLIRRFKREAYLYIGQPPGDNDIMQWLSLMQHHGAPTRLLDWTYSFFIAVFFAVEQVVFNKQGHGECAVWAVDREWLGRQSISQLPEEKSESIALDKDLKEPKTISIIFR